MAFGPLEPAHTAGKHADTDVLPSTPADSQAVALDACSLMLRHRLDHGSGDARFELAKDLINGIERYTSEKVRAHRGEMKPDRGEE